MARRFHDPLHDPFHDDNLLNDWLGFYKPEPADSIVSLPPSEERHLPGPQRRHHISYDMNLYSWPESWSESWSDSWSESWSDDLSDECEESEELLNKLPRTHIPNSNRPLKKRRWDITCPPKKRPY